jgi:hypothetical protein
MVVSMVKLKWILELCRKCFYSALHMTLECRWHQILARFGMHWSQRQKKLPKVWYSHILEPRNVCSTNNSCSKPEPLDNWSRQLPKYYSQTATVDPRRLHWIYNSIGTSRIHASRFAASLQPDLSTHTLYLFKRWARIRRTMEDSDRILTDTRAFRRSGTSETLVRRFVVVSDW